MHRVRTVRTLKVVLLTKPGYRQDGYSRGVILLHLAIDTVMRQRAEGVPRTLTLTAGTNAHSSGGHFRREAVDARSKTFRGPHAARVKRGFLFAVLAELRDGRTWSREEGGRGPYQVFTEHYFGQLEHEGKQNEHFHWQVRKGHTIGLE